MRLLLIFLNNYIFRLLLIFSIKSLFGCARHYTIFINIKRHSQALVEKNTMCNTGRSAISDSGELFSPLVSVSGALDYTTRVERLTLA